MRCISLPFLLSKSWENATKVYHVWDQTPLIYQPVVFFLWWVERMFNVCFLFLVILAHPCSGCWWNGRFLFFNHSSKMHTKLQIWHFDRLLLIHQFRVRFYFISGTLLSEPVSMFIFLFKLEDISPFRENIPMFWSFWWSLSRISKPGGITVLTCFIIYMQWNHQIHLWVRHLPTSWRPGWQSSP